MADALHQITIDAPPERVFAALATSEGLRGWWTVDSQAEPRAGGKAEFGFGDRSTVFRMTIAEYQPAHRLVWDCRGDVEEWNGTRLSWQLRPLDGKTDLRFAHANWRSSDGWFALCNTTWGALMYRLKDYVEGRKPGPLFDGSA